MIDIYVEVCLSSLHILRKSTVIKLSPFSSASCCSLNGRRQIQTAGQQQRVSLLHVEQDGTPLTHSVGLTLAVIDFTVKSFYCGCLIEIN